MTGVLLRGGQDTDPPLQRGDHEDTGEGGIDTPRREAAGEPGPSTPRPRTCGPQGCETASGLSPQPVALCDNSPRKDYMPQAGSALECVMIIPISQIKELRPGKGWCLV